LDDEAEAGIDGSTKTPNYLSPISVNWPLCRNRNRKLHISKSKRKAPVYPCVLNSSKGATS